MKKVMVLAGAFLALAPAAFANLPDGDTGQLPPCDYNHRYTYAENYSTGHWYYCTWNSNQNRWEWVPA